MELLGYGEDSLTLWAFTERLSDVLHQLDDPGSASDAFVVYRPSFGRNSGSSTSPRSEFGELDAIVITDSRVYLMEAKWGASPEFKDSAVTLKTVQRRRHAVMRTYFSEWIALRPTSWNEFRTEASPKLKHSDSDLIIPAAETTLAKNLEYLLRRMTDHPRELQDVVLFIGLDKTTPPSHVADSGFRLVTLSAPVIGGAGYVRLQ